MSVTVLKPPTPLPVFAKKHTVFLAGSIEMGVAEDWQTKFTNALEGRDVLVFNPRRESWDSSWVQSIHNEQFRGQVEWELDALTQANTIVMYFDPKTMSPISLLELGLFAESGKLAVVCPDGFWRKGNVEVVCHRYNIPMYESLDHLIEGFLTRLTEYNKHG